MNNPTQIQCRSLRVAQYLPFPTLMQYPPYYPNEEFYDVLAIPLKATKEIDPTLQTIVEELKSVEMKLAPNI